MFLQDFIMILNKQQVFRLLSDMKEKLIDKPPFHSKIDWMSMSSSNETIIYELIISSLFHFTSSLKYYLTVKGKVDVTNEYNIIAYKQNEKHLL